MTNHYITYQSNNAPEAERWCAYLTKFKVFCFGATEETAINAAQDFYNRARGAIPVSQMAETAPDKAAWGTGGTWGKGKANTGTVWMRHPEHGLKRVAMTEISMYEGNGYVRGGPRSPK